MDATQSSEIFQHIADVKTPWTLTAFAIAVLLALYTAFLAKPNASARKGLWVLVAVICVLALVPISTDAYLQREKIATDADLQRQKLTANSIYRVRVTVVDDRNVPVEGTVVRVTAANEAKTTSDGSAELAIPKGSLPADGKVTIFADKEPAFLHGRKELSPGDDMNLSVMIPVAPSLTAAVNGAVQGEAGRGLKGARVSIPGGTAVETDADGNFRIANAGSAGQKVLVHAEKSGYKPVSQYHPAGDDPVILVLSHTR
jgi:hypothetical protein